MQNDSPIPMKESGKAENANESTAIELHDTGLENVFKAILKQGASKLKKQLEQIELESPELFNEQKDE